MLHRHESCDLKAGPQIASHWAVSSEIVPTSTQIATRTRGSKTNEPNPAGNSTAKARRDSTTALKATRAKKYTRESPTRQAPAQTDVQFSIPLHNYRGRNTTQCHSDCFSRRLSDGRGPGMDPRPPCAFKVSMLNDLCNSH